MDGQKKSKKPVIKVCVTLNYFDPELLVEPANDNAKQYAAVLDPANDNYADLEMQVRNKLSSEKDEPFY